MDEGETAHLAALSMVLHDLAELMHQLAPDLVEAKLRTARLFVQETEAGRIEGQDEQLLRAHRLRRDLLERVVAQNREGP